MKTLDYNENTNKSIKAGDKNHEDIDTSKQQPAEEHLTVENENFHAEDLEDEDHFNNDDDLYQDADL